MQYPMTVYHFQVEWNAARVGFVEVSGLESAVEPIYYREGSSKQALPLAIPGLAIPGRLVLKRGMLVGDNELFLWMSSVGFDQPERRDLRISLLNAQHEPAQVWKIRAAWPVRFQGPVLNALRNEVAIETLELVHEGILVEL